MAPLHGPAAVRHRAAAAVRPADTSRCLCPFPPFCCCVCPSAMRTGCPRGAEWRTACALHPGSPCPISGVLRLAVQLLQVATTTLLMGVPVSFPFLAWAHMIMSMCPAAAAAASPRICLLRPAPTSTLPACLLAPWPSPHARCFSPEAGQLGAGATQARGPSAPSSTHELQRSRIMLIASS